VSALVRVVDAARNNAAWCEAVCAAHGEPGELSEACWLSRAPVPPFYPNLVTLAPEPGPALAAIRELEAALPRSAWSVKDSFRTLDLAPEGLRVLFEAEWLLRPATPPRVRAPNAEVRWQRVRSAEDLAAWEAAWGESAETSRIFLPGLLARSEIAFLAAKDHDARIVAGVIANEAAGGLGLTNFFANREPAERYAEALAAASDAFPGRSLIGYAHGTELARLRALGFASLGPLAVWVRDP
jgi:hypothetical protein